jgi:hypothetical protein
MVTGDVRLGDGESRTRISFDEESEPFEINTRSRHPLAQYLGLPVSRHAS